VISSDSNVVYPINCVGDTQAIWTDRSTSFVFTFVVLALDFSFASSIAFSNPSSSNVIQFFCAISFVSSTGKPNVS
jgi:hypothetical protein